MARRPGTASSCFPPEALPGFFRPRERRRGSRGSPIRRRCDVLALVRAHAGNAGLARVLAYRGGSRVYLSGRLGPGHWLCRLLGLAAAPCDPDGIRSHRERRHHQLRLRDRTAHPRGATIRRTKAGDLAICCARDVPPLKSPPGSASPNVPFASDAPPRSGRGHSLPAIRARAGHRRVAAPAIGRTNAWHCWQTAQPMRMSGSPKIWPQSTNGDRLARPVHHPRDPIGLALGEAR